MIKILLTTPPVLSTSAEKLPKLGKCWTVKILGTLFGKLWKKQPRFLTLPVCVNMLNVLELTDPFWAHQFPDGDPTFNITAERCFPQNVLFSRKVEYVEYVWKLVSKNVFLSGEMLNMRKMCWMFFELIGLIQKGSVSSKKHSTYSTYSAFPQKEAHVSKTFQEHIQHIQHCSRKKHIFSKNKKHMQWHAFHTCNVECWVFWGVLGRVCKFQITQHIQNIQHFPRKKHILRNHSKNTFNIFNITAERSTYLKRKCFFQL